MTIQIVLNKHKNSQLVEDYKTSSLVPTVHYKGTIMALTVIQIKNPSGGPPLSRELQVRKDVVSILPYNPFTNKVLLGKEHRAGAELHKNLDPFLLGVFAGIIDEGESNTGAATRELNEEAQIVIAEEALIPISGAPIFSSSGGSSERATCYIALTDAEFEEKQGLGHAHEHENISSHIFDLKDAIALINSGGVGVMFAVASLYYIKAHQEELLNKARALFKDYPGQESSIPLPTIY